MKVTYVGPSADLDIGVAVIRRDPVVQLVFDDNGDVTGEVEVEPACLTVDVDDELAATLIESGDFVAAEAKSKRTKKDEEVAS